MTLLTASKKSFSEATFRRDRIAYIPASVHTDLDEDGWGERERMIGDKIGGVRERHKDHRERKGRGRMKKRS